MNRIRTYVPSHFTPFGALALVAFAITVGACSAAVTPAITQVPAAQTHAKGGGSTTTIALPATYPASVPLPNGKLLAASGTGTSWTVSLLVPGAYPVVYKATESLYLGAGFVKSSVSENPQFFTNGSYDVTVYSRAYDHGPESTEVLAVVTQK